MNTKINQLDHKKNSSYKDASFSKETVLDTVNESLKPCKERILYYLENKVEPDFGLLMSAEALECYEEIWNELLLREDEKMKIFLLKPIHEISFDDLFYIFEYDLNFEPNTIINRLLVLLTFIANISWNQAIRVLKDKLDNNMQDLTNRFKKRDDYEEWLDHIFCQESNTLRKDCIKKIIQLDRKKNWEKVSHEERDKILSLRQSRSTLKTHYKKLLENENKTFFYTINNIDSLSEMPKELIVKAREDAKKELWDEINALVFYKVTPILRYCSDQKIRKEVSQRSVEKHRSWENRNIEVIIDIINNFNEEARTLWYKNFSEYRRQYQTAWPTKNVSIFIDESWEVLSNWFKQEIDILKSEFQLEQMNHWDIHYYMRKYKELNLDINSKDFNNFFSFESVRSGIETLMSESFWLEFKKSTLKWHHEDTYIYEVWKDNKLIWYLWFDPYTREWKKTTSYASRFNDIGGVPFVWAFNNISDIEREKWLSIDNVRSILHEFWHTLYSLVTWSKEDEIWVSIIPTDSVEMPSKFMEQFILSEEHLRWFSDKDSDWNTITQETLQKVIQCYLYDKKYKDTYGSHFTEIDNFYYTHDYPITDSHDFTESCDNLVDRFGFDSEKGSEFPRFFHPISSKYQWVYYCYSWWDALAWGLFRRFIDEWWNLVAWENVLQMYKNTVKDWSKTAISKYLWMPELDVKKIALGILNEL